MSYLTTTHRLPAPEGSDPVGAGDDLLRQLAERLEVVLPQAGVTTLTWNNSSQATEKVITFPRPFASAPAVVATITSGGNLFYAAVASITLTGFTLRGRRSDDGVSTTTNDVSWVAVRPTT